MLKKRIIEILKSCVSLYSNKLENKNLLFIYGNIKNPKFIETEFLASNLMHLTGTELINGSASQFFENIIDNKLSIGDINIKYKNLTIRKLEVLYSLLNFESTAKMIGIYNDSMLSLKTDKCVGNERDCIGFIKDKPFDRFYHPNTALQIDLKILQKHKKEY